MNDFSWDSNPWVWAITFKIAEGPLPEGRRERPILFRGELVRAILEGRKTQTRRPVKLPSPDGAVYVDPGGTIFGPGPYVKNYKVVPGGDGQMHPRILCPYGYPGDRLWVKETHAIVPRTAYWHDPTIPHVERGDEWAVYRAAWERCAPSRWRASIHMPRWASRLSLEIVSVRVERLHAITEEDARAEGVEPVETTRKVYPSKHAADIVEQSYRAGFEQKWREIHDKARRAA